MSFDLHASGTDDPPQVRNWKIHIFAFIASMSAVASECSEEHVLYSLTTCIVGYDTSVIGGTKALDSFKRDFGLEGRKLPTIDTLQGNIVSTFQAGTFFGALLPFPLAEKFGRRLSIMVASLVFLVGGIMMTAADGCLPLIISGRAVAGLGNSAVSLIVPVHIAETSPPEDCTTRQAATYYVFNQQTSTGGEQ